MTANLKVSFAMDKELNDAHAAATTPTLLDFQKYVPVLERSTTFYYNQNYGHEISSFTLHLMPKGKSAFIMEPHVCIMSGEKISVNAPCMVEFQDDRPAGLVIGFKTIAGADNIYAWMFPAGCGTFEDCKLVHVKLTDLLSVTGEPKNELGENKWLTQLNSYLQTSSMFKQINVKNFLDIKQKFLSDTVGVEVMEKNIELVFNATESLMRQEAKNVALKGKVVIDSVRDAYIKENMPIIEAARTSYENMLQVFLRAERDRYVSITENENSTSMDMVNMVFDAMR